MIIIFEVHCQDIGLETDVFTDEGVMELDGAGMLLIAENVADRTGVMRLRFPGFPFRAVSYVFSLPWKKASRAQWRTTPLMEEPGR